MTVNFDFSLLSPTAHTVAISAYIDFLPSLQYSKPLGTSRFLKTVQCLSPNGYAVVKLLIKPSDTAIDMQDYLIRLDELGTKLKNVQNTLPYDTLIDSERATYLIRPYIRFNLYERMSIRPFFENIEKKWIVYQLLTCISKMHEVNVCHGDLKTENVLLTSWNWIMLSDIGLFKPVYLPNHNQSQFSFYFDTIQRHSCYVAPERFKIQSEIDELMKNPNKVELVPSHDIFSLGCVIAELYTDGLPIFTLPQMFQYRKGEYQPNLDAIEDSNIRKLIQSMISLDPNERLSAKEYLVNYRRIIFPDYFYTFLYPYMKKLSAENDSGSKFQKCDERIDRLHKDFDKISLYLGFKKNIMETDEKNKGKIFEANLIPVEMNLPGMNNHIPQNTSSIFTPTSNNDCSSLILLSLLCNNVRNTTHSSYRIKACDLILAFGEQLHDEAKFDRCLPYLMNMLDDPSENVQIASLCLMTQLLTMVDTITPINTHIFTEYIIPKLQIFLKRSYLSFLKETPNNATHSADSTNNKQDGSYVRMIFACCLPHLAMCSKKFYELSILLKNKIGTYHDPDIDNLIFSDKNRTDIEFDEVVEAFENFTIQMLTDPDVNVRIALMRNIRPLCSFFDKDKTNDIILSHLITYLNDKNPQIKLAFVSCIVPLSIFVGITSLEQYILPLLIQALYEPEEIIVVTLLRVLAQLISLGLIRSECFWDLINSTIGLILHPNGLINQSVINLIIVIGTQISLADFYCMLYPLIRPFFQHEITSFTWENLYIAAHTPLTRVLYNTVRNWCMLNEETLFWQRISNGNNSQNIDAFGNTKISFLRKKNNNGSAKYMNNTITDAEDYVPNFEVPLSNSDLKQIEKLKNLGFKNTDLWKIATLRPYVYKVSKLEIRSNKYNLNNDKVSLMPRSVFFDTKYEYEAIKNNPDTLEESLNNTEPNDKNLNSNIQNQSQKNGTTGRLFLKNLQASKPIVTTNNELVYNKTATSQTSVKKDFLFENVGDANVYDETMQLKKIKTKVSFTYGGKNLFILKFLRSLSFEPDLKDYVEFGDIVDSGFEPKNDSSKKYKTSTLVSKLLEHNYPIIDIISSPDNSYFISVDSQGTLKIWETQRLEIDVTGESCLTVSFGSPITAICMMEKRNCFAIAKKDGSINIFRVDFISSLENKKHFKYYKTSITLVRRWKLESLDMYASSLQFTIANQRPYLFLLTPTSKLIALDIRTMKEVYKYNNNLLHGITTSFVINKDISWAIIGTSKGIIDLWDLQAGICVKSTKFKHSSFPITKMVKLNSFFMGSQTKDTDKLIAFVGGTGDADTIIWDVERAQPRYILGSNNKQNFLTTDMYSVKEVKGDAGEILADLNLHNNNSETNNSCTNIAYHALNNLNDPGVLVCSSHNMKIIEWNLENFENSRVIINTPDRNCINSKGNVVYSETQVNSMLSFVYEKYISDTDDKIKITNSGIPNGTPLMKDSKSTESSNNKGPSDKVTALSYLQKPYPMVVCGDRAGCISVYR